MADINLEKAPYYQSIKNENHSQVLYQPGKKLQAQELNEMQAIQKKIIKDIADSVLKDGDILQGIQIVIDNENVTLTAGKIYLQGVVRPFQQQSVNITRVGQEVIGVKLVSSIDTFQEDDKLLSPASGFDNFGFSGADRLKEVVKVTVNDNTSTPIFLLENGVLINQVTNEDGTLIDRFNSTLARRTYEESGHYKVWGLELSQKAQYDDEYLYLTMSEGKAYVEGWEIDKATATTIPIEKSIDTRSITAEPKVYTSGNNKYKLNNSPVASIDGLTAEVSVSTTMTRQGAVNGTDPIPAKYSPVVDIQTITQVSTGTNYKKNVDFVLESDMVRWLSTGKQPDVGATYNITFTYNKQMIQDIDYKLTVENNEYFVELLDEGDKPVNSTQMQINYKFYLYYIASITLDRFGQVRVVKGQPDTLLNVSPPNITDQSVLLMGTARVAPLNDILYIKNTTTIRTTMEQIQRMYERMEDMEINQAITDLDKEALEGEDATLLRGIFTDGFLGFTKSDINHPEYNAAINTKEHYLTLGFDEEVYELNLDSTKADGYTAYTRLVTGKSKEYVLDNQPYATESMPINPYTDYNYAAKPFHNITVVPITGAKITTTPAYKAKEGDIVTVNVDITDENMAFKEILINGAYVTGDSFTMPDNNVTVTASLKDVTPVPPPKHDIIVIPNDNCQIDTEPKLSATEGQVVKIKAKSTKKDFVIRRLLVNNEPITGNSFTMPARTATVAVTMEDVAPKIPPTISIFPAVDNWIDTNRVVIQKDGGTQVKTTNVDTSGRVINSTRWYERERTVDDVRKSTQTNTNVLDTAIEFMRTREINVTGNRFKANQDNIVVYFNDIKVSATSTNSAYQGSTPGTLRADATGTTKGLFKVPSNIRCGSVNVKIFAPEYPELVGETPYTSKGILRTTQVTNTVTTTVYRNRIYRYVDPVAQTFSFATDQMMSSVGLFFTDLETTEPITLQIRETENGYPSNIILAEKVLTAADLKGSPDGSVETKIALDNIVYCKADTQYAFTVLTNSTESKIFTQTLGGRDLLSSQRIVQNPYLPGMMFSSSNAITWTAHQTKNIKFNLYCNEYNKESTIYFTPINGIDFDRIKILADTSVPVDCSLEWEYSTNDNDWLPIFVNQYMNLPKSIGNVTIRAKVKAKSNVSPTIAIDSLLLVGANNKENSVYVSRNITTDANYRDVKIVADIYNPSGTGVVFYYATDTEGKKWNTLEAVGEGRVKQVGGFTEYTYKATNDSATFKNFRVKAALTTNISTIAPVVKSLKCILK